MPLTNAERQRRFRTRLKAAASTATGLTREQVAARDAVMAEPLYPVPSQGARAHMVRFMGWERYEWSVAPEPLVDFFGMRSAWEGWKREMQALTKKQDTLFAHRSAEADRIVAECGEPALALLRTGGQSALFRAYRDDPTLRIKKRKRVT